MQKDWKGSEEFLLAQLVRLVEQFIGSGKISITPAESTATRTSRSLTLHRGTVPRQSYTARRDIPYREPTDCEEAGGATWLQTRRGHRAPALYEQVLVQQDGYRMTLLSFDEDAVESQEEEDDLRDFWTPRFHRR